ncbi:unnamed protein product [Brugia pahangi]|uniref:60S ribosomal protein L17 n=1 Tax=Brugia pahangi TaxID=6280 RepID=A0A0N4SXU3_BRUPA|nr:unnamed protein product [Brugia pahangi]
MKIVSNIRSRNAQMSCKYSEKPLEDEREKKLSVDWTPMSNSNNDNHDFCLQKKAFGMEANKTDTRRYTEAKPKARLKLHGYENKKLSEISKIAARSKVTAAEDFVIKVGHNLSGKCPTHENKRKSILNKLIINALYVVASKDMKIFNVPGMRQTCIMYKPRHISRKQRNQWATKKGLSTGIIHEAQRIGRELSKNGRQIEKEAGIIACSFALEIHKYRRTGLCKP